MADKHDGLVDAAKKAIDNVHADRSVDNYETLSSLKDIKEHVGDLISAIESDIRD